MITDDLADLMGRRVIDILDRVPKGQQAEVTAIAFVVRWAEGDARHQVVDVAAAVGADAGRTWAPSTFAFPSLGRFGDPETDPDVAVLWATAMERYAPDFWHQAEGQSPASRDPAGTLTAVESLRGRYLALVPHCARRVRRRLRRRVNWGDNWTMFVVTDAAEDQVLPASALVNDGPLPPGLADYLAERHGGAGPI